MSQGAGESLAPVGRDITLCHQAFGDPADPPLVLVMGLGMQLIGWHDDLCAELADHGFHVIRFDNRDSGHSTSLDHIPPPSLRRLVVRRFHPSQYTLADMAEDVAGLLSALGIASAHLVGISMGGMVAQTLAARHRARVRTLTSIMSSTGSRRCGQPALPVYPLLMRPAARGREEFIDQSVRMFQLVGSPAYPPDLGELRSAFARGYDRAVNHAGTARQLAAILKSGDRTAELRRIGTPTLVIHGRADRLVSSSGGRATARAIPGAELVEIDGMGHDLPRELWPRIVGSIASRARARDGVAARA